MTGTGTDPRSPKQRACGVRRAPHAGRAAAALAAAALAAGALAAALAGCSSSEMRSVSAPAGLTDATFRHDAGLVPAAAEGRDDEARRVVSIEPDPVRDAEVHALLRRSLDSLRAGEIQPALDLLMQAQSIEGWERSEHAPAVLFWTGHAYDQLGERFAAMGAFRRITLQYPRSAFAERAARRLRELRSRTSPAQR